MRYSTYTDLVNAIASVLPEATFGEDNEGQIIVYTDHYQRSGTDQLGKYVECDEQDL